MFYTAEIEDRVKIGVKHLDMEGEVWRRVEERYVGRMLEDTSICILVTRVVSICEYRVFEEFLVAEVRFEMLLFKFLRDEVVCGQIAEQSDEGMRLCVPFFDRLGVKESSLPSVCERVVVDDGGERQRMWVWVYKNNRLYFRKGDDVRFRIKEVGRRTLSVSCSLGETGLGPLAWWI